MLWKRRGRKGGQRLAAGDLQKRTWGWGEGGGGGNTRVSACRALQAILRAAFHEMPVRQACSTRKNSQTMVLLLLRTVIAGRSAKTCAFFQFFPTALPARSLLSISVSCMVYILYFAPQLVSELATQATEEEKLSSQQEEAAERFGFFQQTRNALSDLCGMLREKVCAGSRCVFLCSRGIPA